MTEKYTEADVEGFMKENSELLDSLSDGRKSTADERLWGWILAKLAYIFARIMVQKEE